MWSVRGAHDRVERSPSTVVLLYHRIGMPRLSSLVAGQYVLPRFFRAQLDYLTYRGWNALALPQVVELLGQPDGHDCNSFAVTFDDAYLGVYDHACPALADRNMTATVFVVVDRIGGVNEWDSTAGDVREPLMSAGQIREIAQLGFEIGSHTLTHPHLVALNESDLRREIVDSKKKLEDIIGKEVLAFSYPYGEYDDRVLAAVAEAGYGYAVATRLGTVQSDTDPFTIPRVNIRWNTVGRLLMRKIRRAERTRRIRR
ncbi:MAG: polysaccharide deacetylase family protein [Armatimonadetes bacterium]|nr:polysaccharide deacetylase family protein [Armatimonadota bacterium]